MISPVLSRLNLVTFQTVQDRKYAFSLKHVPLNILIDSNPSCLFYLQASAELHHGMGHSRGYTSNTVFVLEIVSNEPLNSYNENTHLLKSSYWVEVLFNRETSLLVCEKSEICNDLKKMRAQKNGVISLSVLYTA